MGISLVTETSTSGGAMTGPSEVGAWTDGDDKWDDQSKAWHDAEDRWVDGDLESGADEPATPPGDSGAGP
jgi:hypothetical protein